MNFYFWDFRQWFSPLITRVPAYVRTDWNFTVSLFPVGKSNKYWKDHKTSILSMRPESSVAQEVKPLTIRALGSVALSHCVCLPAWYRICTCGFWFHVSALAFPSFTVSSFHTNVTHCQRKDMAFRKTSILLAKRFRSDPYKCLKHPEGLALDPPTDMILKHCPDLISDFRFMSQWFPPDTQHSISLWW